MSLHPLRSLLLIGVLLTASASATEPTEVDLDAVPSLRLEDVLSSAESSFPLLQAARLEPGVRRNAARSAAGAFDTRLSLRADLTPLGFYENETASVSLEQPTRYWGSRLYARYRFGDGDTASYQGGFLTDETGEVSAGLELSLLRNRNIDSARAKIRKAAIDLQSVNPELVLARVEVERDASLAYWDWVAAGQIVRINEELLAVAQQRQTQIARRVERGSEAKIDLSDNQRLVVERQALLRGAQRDFRQATLVLSLFYRDPEGQRIVVGDERLPTHFPEELRMETKRVQNDLARARENHPKLRKLALKRDELGVDLDLAQNDVLPKLDVGVEGSQDFGASRPGIDERGKLSPDSRSSTEVKVKARFALPIQLRSARGRLGAARIRIDQLERRLQFAREQVETDILIALEALSSSFDETSQARENVELAEILRQAEVRKLNAGLSNLIDVNIREVQAASASQKLVYAQKAYFQSLALYRASVVTLNES